MPVIVVRSDRDQPYGGTKTVVERSALIGGTVVSHLDDVDPVEGRCRQHGVLLLLT